MADTPQRLDDLRPHPGFGVIKRDPKRGHRRRIAEATQGPRGLRSYASLGVTQRLGERARRLGNLVAPKPLHCALADPGVVVRQRLDQQLDHARITRRVVDSDTRLDPGHLLVDS